MSTCRRRLLDQALENAIPLMRGRVLDIGGKKKNRRGRFRPPLQHTESWEYLNADPETHEPHEVGHLYGFRYRYQTACKP